jgi:CheY-like chemotaxis protein
MSRIGPIIVIEDDPDDRQMLKDVFQQLRVKNELRFFDNCPDAYDYLKVTSDKPFIIFSDINLPKMTGAELKKLINKDDKIRRKSIPFVFLTTTSDHQSVLDSYESLSQGYFTKPNTFQNLVTMVEMILNYWKIARHPNPNLLG